MIHNPLEKEAHLHPGFTPRSARTAVGSTVWLIQSFLENIRFYNFTTKAQENQLA
jgi:hypothetical protein